MGLDCSMQDFRSLLQHVGSLLQRGGPLLAACILLVAAHRIFYLSCSVWDLVP